MQQHVCLKTCRLQTKPINSGIRSECHGQNANVWNATDLCVWDWGVVKDDSGKHTRRKLPTNLLKSNAIWGVTMILSAAPCHWKVVFSSLKSDFQQWSLKNSWLLKTTAAEHKVQINLRFACFSSTVWIIEKLKVSWPHKKLENEAYWGTFWKILVH